MKTPARTLTRCSFVLTLIAGGLGATPSSTFWTPMTIDFQSYGVLHIGMDNYFSVRKQSPGAFPTDFTSPTVGVLPFNKLRLEVGVDYWADTPSPWLFNAKIGSPEDVWFKGQPAVAAGVFNAGTETSGPLRTDYDIAYLVMGKSLGPIGRVAAGPYIGNHAALLSSRGENRNKGMMVAFDHGFLPVKGAGGDYNRLVFAADYASGNNALGGGGFGFYYYFTKDVSLLAGPTFFNDTGLNGKWKLSVQLDINLPRLFAKR